MIHIIMCNIYGQILLYSDGVNNFFTGYFNKSKHFLRRWSHQCNDTQVTTLLVLHYVACFIYQDKLQTITYSSA